MYYGQWIRKVQFKLTAAIQVLVVECAAVTIAMYCLIQFYVQVKDDIQQHSPFLKILSIKLVIFLCFWQSVSAIAS